MKHILTDAEFVEMVENTNYMYEKGMADMWNIIKSHIDKYYYLNGETDNGILVILNSIKEQTKIDYNSYYHDPKNGF